MSRNGKIIRWLAVLCLVWSAAASAGSLQYPQHGFRIDALDESVTEPPPSMMMVLPVQDGFRPNVNIQIQPFAGSIDVYLQVTRNQFDQYGLEMKKLAKGEDFLTLEYTGLFQGRKLYWYARALKRENKVYLITATALESHWEELSRKLKACVNSFAFL